MDRGIEIDKGTNWQEPDSHCHITIPQNNVYKVELEECQSSSIVMSDAEFGDQGYFAKSKVSEVKNGNDDSPKDEAGGDNDRTSFTLNLLPLYGEATEDSHARDRRKLLKKLCSETLYHLTNETSKSMTRLAGATCQASA